MKNHLWNMFNNITNGLLIKRKFIVFKHRGKKFCEAFLNLLWNEGFISGYNVNIENPDEVVIYLKYLNKKPVINAIKLVSRPGKKLYYNTKQLWKIDSTKNYIVFSTNKGLMSLNSCKKLKIGGEPIAVVG